MSQLSDAKQLVLQFFTKELVEYAIRNISLGSDGTIVVECVHPISQQLQSVNGVPVIYAMIDERAQHHVS